MSLSAERSHGRAMTELRFTILGVVCHHCLAPSRWKSPKFHAWKPCRSSRTRSGSSSEVTGSKSTVSGVKACCTAFYDQPDAASVHAQFDRIVDALTDKLPRVAEHLERARADILAFTAFPKELWRQIWSNNPRSD